MPIVSKYLSAMLEADIVSRRKEGLNAICRVSDETIFELCDVGLLASQSAARRATERAGGNSILVLQSCERFYRSAEMNSRSS